MTHMNDESCIFCRIARKQVPASTVYEDETVMAFMDIRPLSKGHTLIIPKDHYMGIFDIPEELLANVHAITKRVAVAVKKATEADGISIFQQNGKAAGQEVFHLHVHVVPRHEGQRLGRFGEILEIDREKLDRVAAKIKLYMEALKQVNV
jgi:histidine triad (HIT) family protein